MCVASMPGKSKIKSHGKARMECAGWRRVSPFLVTQGLDPEGPSNDSLLYPFLNPHFALDFSGRRRPGTALGPLCCALQCRWSHRKNDVRFRPLADVVIHGSGSPSGIAHRRTTLLSTS